MRKTALFGALSVWFVACGPSVKRVDVEPGQAIMSTKGSTVALHAIPRDERGQPVADQKFDWSSSNPQVATVDPTGIVTAVKSGTAMVSATVGDMKGTSQIKVTIPGSLAIEPPQLSLQGIGQGARLRLIVKDDAGNVVSGMPAIWLSSDPNVAAVDASGDVKSMGGGEATVTAHTGALSAVARVTVAQPTFDKLAIAPKGPLKLKPGKTAQLTATAMNGKQPVPGITVKWSSDDAKVAQVSPLGLVTAAKKGKATITATAGAKTATLKVQVK
ncbi:MAG: Ig-like domain-containing protein [Deltaproteobacteria bacterium]